MLPLIWSVYHRSESCRKVRTMKEKLFALVEALIEDVMVIFEEAVEEFEDDPDEFDCEGCDECSCGCEEEDDSEYEWQWEMPEEEEEWDEEEEEEQDPAVVMYDAILEAFDEAAEMYRDLGQFEKAEAIDEIQEDIEALCAEFFEYEEEEEEEDDDEYFL